MKKFLLILSSVAALTAFGQGTPNNCNGAVPGCTTPSFGIQPSNPATNIVDFTSGSISNPSTNPNGGNSGCLLSGETSSTFITISVVSSGTLQWSIEGPSGGCFDWIMWPYVNSQTTCAGINGNTLPPVSCNWNGACEGFTGMANPLPVSGEPSNFEAPLNVTAGQTYLLCLSNYSGTSQNVNLNFFGSANVACQPSAPDQTICLGNSANVTIATPGLPSPSFNWLVTTGVSNPTGGTNVTVTPTQTTTYQVQVTNPATPTAPPFSEIIEFTITVANPPAPNAGPDQTVCFGQPIYLSGTEGVSSNSSSWSTVVPPGMTPPATATYSPNFSSLTPTITVNQPGLYKFVLREVSTVCGTIRDTVNVTVSEMQQTVAKVDPSCGGYSDGQIQINSTTNAVEYSFNNGSTWQTSSSASGFAAGTYTVCSRNALGCQKCSSVTLVNPVPVTISVSNDTLICQNGTATLIATGGNGTSFTYAWQHTTSTAGTQTVNPTTDSYYRVMAINQSGCTSASDSIHVTLRAPLSGDITPGFSICPGYGQTITAAANGGIGAPYTYTWTSGDLTNGAMSTIPANPSATQTFTVVVADACETTPLVLSTEVIVAPVPQPQFSVVDGSICEPAVFEIINTTDPAMVGGAYWVISDGQTFQAVDTITTAPMYEGSYNVQLVVTSPEGCIDSVTYQNFLVSNPKPVAEFKWSPNPIQMFNTEVVFANQSIHGYTYQWAFEEGSPGTSTEENPRILFPDGEVGDYDIMLITTSEFGCVDTAYHVVSVLPEVLLYAPNAFTPDDNEFNQRWRVYMQGVDVTRVTLRVFDRWGQVVWESHDLEEEWDGTLNGVLLPNGTYTWTIQAKDAITDAMYDYRGHVSILR